jgi:protocatechuate 3,4-dioxygenase beta subunit
MGGVELEVSMNQDWQSGAPGINFQGHVTTDKQGRFQFAKVPPRRVDIQRVIRMSPNSWQSRPQTWLVALPGITNDLGKVTYDTPPPPPVMDRLKQRLGL